MSSKIFEIDFKHINAGSVAIWPAYPAIFSNVTVEKDPNMNTGIHIHLRHKRGGKKIVDDTFDLVKIKTHKQDKYKSSDTFELTYSEVKLFLTATLLKKRNKINAV